MSLCLHPPEHVTADILEGDLAAKTDNNRQIQWCRLCGAWRNTWDENSSAKGSWRVPENANSEQELKQALITGIEASVKCILAQRQRDALMLFIQNNVHEMSLSMLKSARSMFENLDNLPVLNPAWVEAGKGPHCDIPGDPPTSINTGPPPKND